MDGATFPPKIPASGQNARFHADPRARRFIDQARWAIEEHGFFDFTASQFVGAVGDDDWPAARQAAEECGLDGYDKGSRKRAYGTATFQPHCGIVTPTQPYQRDGRRYTTYLQDVSLNSEANGLAREFEPVPGYLMNSEWLHSVIRILFEACPSTILPRGYLHQVGIHLITNWTELTKGVHGVPRFLHRDGEWVTAVLLLHKSINLLGGESLVAGPDWAGRHPDDVEDGTLRRFALDHPLDGFIFDDRRISHGVGFMRSIDGALASRSVMLIDFSPLQPLRV